MTARPPAHRLAMLLLSLVAGQLPAAAQPAGTLAEPVLTADPMREGLRVMRTGIEESHAGLYWHLSRADLGRRFDAVAAGIDGPASVRAVHRRLLPVMAAVRARLGL